MTTLITCEYLAQLPPDPHVTYSIGVGETVDDCLRKFKTRFGVEPKTAWHWQNFVYCEKP